MFASVATLVVVAACVSAAPVNRLALRADACDIASCGIALAPTGVGCVGSAVEIGANPLADAGCIASVVNLGVNTPDVCKPCFNTVGDTVTGVAKEAGDAITNVAEDAGNAIAGAFSGLFGRDSCDIVSCGVTLAPTGVGCVSSAVELGANPLADVGCVASVVNLGVNVPDVCKPCFSTVGDTVTSVAEDAGNAIAGAAEDAGDAISGAFSSLFGRDDTCDIVSCGATLAPTGVGCVSSAVELGANPLADAGCVASVVNLGVNVPDVCKPCFGTVGSAVTTAAQEAGDAITGAFDDVKDGLSSLFGREEY